MKIIPVTAEQLNTLPELALYSEKRESQLLHANEPHPGLFAAESEKVLARALAAGYEPVSILAEEKELTPRLEALLSPFPDIPLYLASSETLSALVGYSMMRGIAALMIRKRLTDPLSLINGKTHLVLLERILNPTNLGAIFRSAAALGMDAVILSPGCTDPLYRRAARVSMGGVFQIPWTSLKPNKGSNPLWPRGFLQVLKERGFYLAAMALTENARILPQEELSERKPLALIMGSEEEGVSPEALSLCDGIFQIPMSHGVDSLNVAAASALAFWEVTKGRQSL